MGLTNLSIKRPLTMLMIILAFVVMGYRAMTMLSIDRMPKADIPYVSVVTIFAGASPDDVSSLIIEPIEDAVAGIAGIDEITSQANENYGYVVIKFKEGINGDQAAIDVSRQVNAIRGDLPAEAEEPTIVKADINATPIMQIVLSGPQGSDALYNIASGKLKDRLQAINGVASVSVAGGRTRQVQVYADPTKLAAYGLPVEYVAQALQQENVTFPVGSIDQGMQKNSVRSVGEFASLSDIENIVVAGGPSLLYQLPLPAIPEDLAAQLPTGLLESGGNVYLKDVATVQDSFEDASRMVRFNGQAAVLVTIVKTSDANAIDVADAVRVAVDDFRPNLPASASLSIAIDDTAFTRESVTAVQEDLLLAIVITGIVMLLFLHTITSSVIVMLSVPTSMIATFLIMWWQGFSLNTVTLMALTVAIGILVDDSIVVLENTERHLKMGKSPADAAIEGRAEIGMAAITITAVIVVVYLPVAFMSGIIGQMFFSYGITIAAATIFSLLISFTLTPMLAARWLKAEDAERRPPTGLRKVLALLFSPVGWLWQRFIRLWEALFDGLAGLYAAILRATLANPFTQLLAVLIAAGALVAGIWLVVGGVVGAEFLPQEDDGRITVGIEMPAGSNLVATDRAARRAEQLIRAEVPETAMIITQVGTKAGNALLADSASANNAVLTVRLVDKSDRSRSTSEVVRALRPVVRQIPDATVSLLLNTAVSGLTNDIQVRLYGPDQEKLIDLAQQAEAVIRTVPGATDIRNSGADRSPETRLVIDRRRAKDVGLSPAAIARTLRIAVNGAQMGTVKLDEQGDDLDLILRMPAEARTNPRQLLHLPLAYLANERVTLGQVAAVEETRAPASISRAGRQPELTIIAGASGRGSADVANDIEQALTVSIDFPAGYGFDFAGQTDIQRDSFTQLSGALLLSILLIYMLLVAQYQNWLHPLAIMFALPVTLVGAFGGLWLTGNTLNVMSLLGIIMLAGIVVKNAILLVDFTNILRFERGYSRREALIEAGRLRLRPILMTTFAIVFALLPLLFGQGAGAELRAPLAAVVIGGNVSSTLLTLILVPVVYNFFDWAGSRVNALAGKVLGREADSAAAEPQTV